MFPFVIRYRGIPPYGNLVHKKKKHTHTLIADTISGNVVVYIVGYKANKYYK